MMSRSILRAQTRAVIPRGAVLHGSAVAAEERAFLFLATSGGGKSTVRLKLTLEKYGAIGDDSIVISRGTDDVVRCLPCGSMKQNTGIEDIRGAPLEAVFFLEKGSPPELFRVSGRYGFDRLMRTRSIMAYDMIDQEERRAVRSFLRGVLHEFPVFVFRYGSEDDPMELMDRVDR